ncbi:MAG TPA: guanosine monophosphate reductase [Candidatus Methanoperedens sp.]|nr:guanosine monophosphate reductase [Candidatus Methanoperedens sp.]
MKILSNTPELTFNDVLLLPAYSDFSMIEDTIKTNLKTKISKNLEIDIPICSSPMPNISETKMAIALGKLGGIAFLHCFQSFKKQLQQVKEIKKHHVKIAVSVSDFSPKGLQHVSRLLKLKTDLICIETAQAENLQTINFLKKIKKKHPSAQVCVALVVTGKATEALIKAGADSIRVGIGGGSHCTTRLVTGVGRPQLSAVLDCYQIAKKYNVPLISDTGIEHAGDITKAIAFGASAVMIGGLFSGTDECPGPIITRNGQNYKFSAGMCSNQTEYKPKLSPINYLQLIKTIIKKIIHYPSSNKNHFVSSYSQPFSFTHEGVSGLIPYKGSVIQIVGELVGGLRRSMWYLGCKNLDEIRKNTEVVVVSPNTTRDNIPRI